MRHITEIVNIEPFMLELRFDNGEVLNVDLKKRLQKRAALNSNIYEQLLNVEYFKTVKLNPEMQSIYWDNGIDFCPDVLYMMAKNIPFKFNDEQ